MPDDPSERIAHHARAPAHLFRPGATYFLTAKTLHGEKHLLEERRRSELIKALKFATEQRGWHLIAWVALANHYDALLRAPAEVPADIDAICRAVHRYTAANWNREDQTPGRTLWYQYRDTCITSIGSFWARWNYIHYNPVKHGLVTRPEDYSYSSYRHWTQSDELDIQAMEDAYPWERLVLE